MSDNPPVVRWLVLVVLVSGCAQRLVPELPEPRRADAIVVLGNRPPVDAEGKVRPELRRRIEAGVQLFEAGLAPRIVMTGGPAPSGHIEAEVMRDLAIELGVPRDAILVEGRSRDTIENAGFTLRLLCGNDPNCVPSVIVVSTRYHLARAKRLFECAGARVQIAASALPEDEPNYAKRLGFSERFVRLYYGFIRPCDRVRRARSGGPTR